MMRFNFNLIEILLAVVILSLGMTSVFVLFPAGLSNHKTAMAENSFADMAELIVSHVRAEAALSSNHEGFNYDLGTSDTIDTSVKYDYDNDDGWTKVNDAGTVLKKNSRTFLVRQLSGPADNQYTDFAAIALVRKDSSFGNEIVVPKNFSDRVKYSDMTKSATATLQSLDIDKFVIPLVLEISYPADKDYEAREKVYFRFEIFNENFELKKRVTP